MVVHIFALNGDISKQFRSIRYTNIRAGDCVVLRAFHISDECFPMSFVHPRLGFRRVIFPVMGERRNTVHIAGAARAGLPALSIVAAEPSASAACIAGTA